MGQGGRELARVTLYISRKTKQPKCVCVFVSECVRLENFYLFFVWKISSFFFISVFVCMCVLLAIWTNCTSRVKMIMIRTVKSKQQHFPAIPSSRVVKRHIYATCITIIFGIEKICAAATWAVCHGPNPLRNFQAAKLRPGHYKIHIYISIINISNRFIGS